MQLYQFPHFLQAFALYHVLLNFGEDYSGSKVVSIYTRINSCNAYMYSLLTRKNEIKIENNQMSIHSEWSGFGPWPGTLCCVLGQDTTLTVPPSAQVYKWVLVNLMLGVAL